PASPLPAPFPYIEQFGGLIERCEPASRPVSPVRTARRIFRSRPPPVPGTHAMALRPSSVPLRVPLPAPPESSLPEVPDPESDRARATSPTVSRLLATAVTNPSFESAATSALIAELLEFAAACHLKYATALVAKSASACPPSVGGECAIGTDVLEERKEDFECLATAVPHFTSMLLAPEGDLDAPDFPTPRSYAEWEAKTVRDAWRLWNSATANDTRRLCDRVAEPGFVDRHTLLKGAMQGAHDMKVRRILKAMDAVRLLCSSDGDAETEAVVAALNKIATPGIGTFCDVLSVLKPGTALMKSKEPGMGVKGLGPKSVSKLRLACALVAVNLKPSAWVAVLFPDTWEEQMPKTVADMAKQTAPVLRPPTKRKKVA
ncbi:unnamed protein product, partial [Closterium sp. NIES-54]